MQVSCISQHRELLERSLADLRRQVDRHQECLRALVAEEGSDASCGCVPGDCPHHTRFCQVLLEAVGILEETRKAFKSKRLESLRKAFLRVLQEELQTQRPPA